MEPAIATERRTSCNDGQKKQVESGLLRLTSRGEISPRSECGFEFEDLGFGCLGSGAFRWVLGRSRDDEAGRGEFDVFKPGEVGEDALGIGVELGGVKEVKWRKGAERKPWESSGSADECQPAAREA